MKMLFLFLLLNAASAALCDNPDAIPTFPIGNRFHGWDCNQIVRSMGSNLLHPQCSERIPDLTIVIQESLDWRTEEPACVAPIRDQGSCGSCWAFASSRSLAHRFCILTPDLPRNNYILSPQYLIDCDHGCYDNDPQTCQMGCAGGYLDLVWRFLRDNGTVLDSCQPYTATDGTCTTTNCDRFRSLDRYTVRTVANIQREIQQYGPVMAGLMVYSDFLGYTSGIYHKQDGTQPAGGHAVSIVGWGTEIGVDYWICENQWGTSWGEQGYFRIRRGTNEVGIEEFIHTGRPNITGLVYAPTNDQFLSLDTPSSNGVGYLELCVSVYAVLIMTIVL